jgi:hypothetical protein
VAIQTGAAHTFSCAGSSHHGIVMPASDLLKLNKVSKRLHWSSSNSAHVPRSRQVKRAPTTQQEINLANQRGVQQKIEMGWTGQVLVFNLHVKRVIRFFFFTCVFPKGPQDRAWVFPGWSQPTRKRPKSVKEPALIFVR